jgi:hypothetical protein
LSTSPPESPELPQESYEKLGAFYLGRLRDPATGERTEQTLLYDSRDLTTHGVIIGMTGSGKTGLALAALEEAAMDRIPVIAIDPKGDLANLMLTFPELAPSDFRPWINEEVARQRGEDPDAFAAGEAEKWRSGLAGWGQDGERIRRLRDHADFSIYTPGSAAGRQVSVLRSFAVPGQAVLEDPDALRERIQSTVTSLLALMGIRADPIRSREHILLSNILQNAWEHGRSLELGQLIEAIQRPPFARIGVMELESFYPSKDRFDLALALNGILASPGFQAWMEGEPLHIPSFLYTPAGKPRVTIFSIAHLGDDERMFFVAMLLNEILSWMRGQSGTSSLRALVYMDEIFGFFPPSANPPSKAPMLTLLKQARAFGVGMLLATQNPVDLDYKGLGNTGTWFIGRLQTERDKARIMDALLGAMDGSAPLSRQELDRLISGLGQRQFLLHNVHEGAPVLLETRWVMSYMAGPMTLQQLRVLARATPQAGASQGEGAGDVEARASALHPDAAPPSGDSASAGAPDRGAAAAGPVAPVHPSAPPSPPPTGPPPTGPAPTAASRPLLPPGIQEYFLAPTRGGGGFRYTPALGVFCDVSYRNARAGVDESRQARVLLPFAAGPVAVDWDRAEEVELEIDHLESEPLDATAFGDLPPDASQARSYTAWGREAQRWIQANVPLTLLECRARKAISRPGETESEFRLRLADLRRAARDEAVDRIRKRYEPRIQTLQERERRALQAVEKRAAMAQQRTLDTALRVGEGLLGAFLGRRTSAARTGTAVRSAGRVLQGRQEVAQAEETVEAVRAQVQAMEDEFAEELRKVEASHEGDGPLEEVQVRATLTGMSVRLSALLWLPEDGSGRALWR